MLLTMEENAMVGLKQVKLNKIKSNLKSSQNTLL